MIHDLDSTIKELLDHELNRDGDEIEISFSQPSGEWASRNGSKPALNLFLYDVRENPSLRRHQWQQTQMGGNGSSRRGSIALKRTPLMLDCFYMVTAWSGADERTKPFQEHWLLSRCLKALARYPLLNPPFEERERAEALADTRYQDGGEEARELVTVERPTDGHMTTKARMEQRAWLNDGELNLLRDIEIEVRTRIAHHDVLTNPAEVWSALESQMKASFSYVVTLPLDPWTEVETDQIQQSLLQFEGDMGLYAIGGAIRNQAGEPQPNVVLRIVNGDVDYPLDQVTVFEENEQYSTKTNSQGEYRLSGLHAGAYTLLIECSTGEVVSRDLMISPNGPTGYDFTI